MKPLFSTLASVLPEGVAATLVIKTTAGGRMSVITSFNDEKGALCGDLPSFNVKGTPDEMDEGFLTELAAPVETVKGLVSNIAQFRKAAEQAEKNAKAAAAKTASSGKTGDAAARMVAEQKRREAEKKAREANYSKTVEEVKKESAKGNYFTAQALLKLAATLTDDKKVKADLDKQVKQLGGMTGGFLCTDSEDAAKVNVEEFKKGLATADTFLKEAAPAEDGAPATAETQEAGEQKEEESQDDSDIPEDNEENKEE